MYIILEPYVSSDWLHAGQVRTAAGSTRGLLGLAFAALRVHVVTLCFSCLLCPLQRLQSALDAEMEERRKRVEEWRKKRAAEAAAAAAAEQERKQQEEAAAAAAAAAENSKKGWSLEDDEDDDEPPQQAGGEVRLGGQLCSVVHHRPSWVEDASAQALPGFTSVEPCIQGSVTTAGNCRLLVLPAVQKQGLNIHCTDNREHTAMHS